MRGEWGRNEVRGVRGALSKCSKGTAENFDGKVEPVRALTI
jgi:hypothetical protein